MLFELSIVRKYLSPKQNQLSVSLIALMSIAVISVVVWLVLVFLSVTEGIERSWLEKITALNGAIKIQPTEKYFSSYYHRIDSYAAASGYSSKNIKQKALAPLSDPYDPNSDEELPLGFPKSENIDPVKKAYNILAQFQEKIPGFAFQDFEVSGALLRLQLLRSDGNHFSHQFLTQVSYLASFSEQNPHLDSLLIHPSPSDLNHLLFLAGKKWDHVCEDIPNSLQQNSFIFKNLLPILKNIQIEKMKTNLSLWKAPSSFLPENTPFDAIACLNRGQITHFILPKKMLKEQIHQGKLEIRKNTLLFTEQNAQKQFPLSTPLYIEGPLTFKTQLVDRSLSNPHTFSDIQLKVNTTVQNHSFEGIIPWEGVQISKASIQHRFTSPPEFTPPWAYILEKAKSGLILPQNEEKAVPIFLSKNFRDNGVMIGDRGYLSYPSMTASGLQEQRFMAYVAGFYDGGIMAASGKYILVPPKVAEVINASNSPYSVDRAISNGLIVWFATLGNTEKIKQELKAAFQQEGIDSYWKIIDFKEYDFAKDLLQQFQSDKYLFTLIGIIVLIVACSNIISMLILLVQNKRREIGILQAMGASKQSIALIFGICGILIGLISSLIGIALALLTLHNIDFVVKILSMLQGHEAFNALFFGNSLPNKLSEDALYFILIATPLLSLIAGLIPAIKACNLRPSQILRSE